jgi:GT2 family glycosyltransferase
VVVPVHNGGRSLERCLRGLRASTWTDYELIVVDDGSTDGSARRAEAAGARVISITDRRGPALARNRGVEAARAHLIFFLDGDVVPHEDTLARAFARFEADPTLDALFGSYDDRPHAPGLVSRYRNLLHHYVHQKGEFHDDVRPAHTFWTGCGVIRRAVFLAHGGFDPELYRRPAIEDIELGYRLTRAGHRIVLARDVQVTHLKRWTLGRLIRTDILQRGVPWMLLILRSGTPETDLNVSPGQRLSVGLTGLSLVGLCAATFWPAALAISAGCLACTLALNRRFYRFLARRGGPAFALKSVPLHHLYFVCCGLSVLIAWAMWIGIPSTAGDRLEGTTKARPDLPGVAVPTPWFRRLLRRRAVSGRGTESQRPR